MAETKTRFIRIDDDMWNGAKQRGQAIQAAPDVTPGHTHCGGF